MKSLCIDLFCGLGGWAEGFLAEGYRVVGFDIERHDYGSGRYPGQLVLQDALTLHGSQFRDAAVIVASPPCQEYSYMAMPWSRAKQIAREYESGVRDVKQLTALFDCCFRIQREASEAAGHHIPLIVENVRGAQRWAGRAKWHFGSYYLWGDLPALMPSAFGRKTPIGSWDLTRKNYNADHSWDGCKTSGNLNRRDGHSHTHHLTNQAEHEGTKQGGDWFGKNCESSMSRLYGSKSVKRRAASAEIAKIPFPLASHIARCFLPC